MSTRKPLPPSATLTTRNPVVADPSENDIQILNLAFVGSLLPGILHNLATPLSGVLGATQLLEKRASAMADLVAFHEELTLAERDELIKHLERNRANVEILERNSRHLADLLQNIVQRITRGSSGIKDRFPLNDLLTSELKFLDANLTFKHKVRKSVRLGADVPPLPYLYGDLASLLDEFVTEAIAAHDFRNGVLDMEFVTESSEQDVSLRVRVRPSEFERSFRSSTLDSYLELMRSGGWRAEVRMDSEGLHLLVSCPRELPEN